MEYKEYYLKLIAQIEFERIKSLTPDKKTIKRREMQENIIAYRDNTTPFSEYFLTCIKKPKKLDEKQRNNKEDLQR